MYRCHDGCQVLTAVDILYRDNSSHRGRYITTARIAKSDTDATSEFSLDGRHIDDQSRHYSFSTMMKVYLARCQTFSKAYT